MKNAWKGILFATALAGVAMPALGADLKIGANDTVQSILAAQKGQRVTVRVHSGQEITGVVREVTARVVQLGAVSSKEFFDAVVPLEAVDAVYVRTKD